MSNYKFFIIFLMTASIIIMTGISYAQFSEQIPSPKKQIDNDVAPYDVVCRNDLLLVERSIDNIACVSENTAQIFNWHIIDPSSNTTTKDSEPSSEEFYSDGPHTLAEALFEQSFKHRQDTSPSIFTPSLPVAYPSIFTPWPVAYPNGSFSNLAYVDAIFPQSVSVGDAFTIEYSWSTNGLIPIVRDLTSMKKDLKNFNHSMMKSMTEREKLNVSIITSDVEFINPKVPRSTYCDTDYLHTYILYDSDNIEDRSGNVTVKFKNIFNSTEYKPAILIGFLDHTFIEIHASSDKDGMINLKRSTEPRPEFKFTYDCDGMDSLPTSNTSNPPVVENSIISEIPDCIHEQSWGYLYEDEKITILENPTTCQMINGTHITNLPDGWNRIQKPDFDTMIQIMDDLSMNTPEELLEFGNISGNWTDDFISYYYNISK